MEPDMKKIKILNQEETIKGFIKEIDDNNSSALAILTDDGYYIVRMNQRGKLLLNETGSKVEASGYIETDINGTNRIIVNQFEVFEPEDDFLNYDDYMIDDYDTDWDNWD
jgi:hypothetical protein